eukprot:TRINITY_DN20320_c0_g1_i1.p1 TRINITY_DN20320_c0_g1~~TRINITY_DN20320_c0_g1_i1.p1  ORF type:complete len:269 (+),score=54.27 TRINITY_DN20320_c0_g1_i1:156-962(+)
MKLLGLLIASIAPWLLFASSLEDAPEDSEVLMLLQKGARIKSQVQEVQAAAAEASAALELHDRSIMQQLVATCLGPQGRLLIEVMLLLVPPKLAGVLWLWKACRGDAAKPHRITSLTKKLSQSSDKESWRRKLGETMESTWVTGTVILLILVDVSCTAINDALENTDLLSAKYHEQGELWAKVTHRICVCVLCLFMLEQILHIVSFGAAFFSHFWYVLDFIIVYISLVCESQRQLQRRWALGMAGGPCLNRCHIPTRDSSPGQHGDRA